MSDEARRVSWARAPALGWLMARAFTSNRAAAVCAVPTALLSIAPYVLRGAAYESADGDGMVLFGRYRPVLDVLLAIPLALFVMILTSATLIAGGVGLGPVGLLVSAAIVGIIGFGGLAMVTAFSLSTATGAETPEGPRWTVMGLAQRPGTRLSALILTRALLRTVPAGGVVVAVAGSEELAAGYVRLGFTRGRGPRVYRRQ